MSVSSMPSLTEPQKEVLNTLPEPSGRNKRAYKALVEKGLVFKVSNDPLQYERKELGDQVLAQLREDHLVAPVEDEEVASAPETETETETVELVEPNLTEEDIAAEAPQGPTLALVPPEAVEPEVKTPESSGDGAGEAEVQPEVEVSTCKWCHEEKPLTKEHWYRKSDAKGGGFYIEGRCRGCESDYRKTLKARKANGEVTPRTRHSNRPGEAEAIRESEETSGPELTVIEGDGGHPEYVIA